MKTEPFKVVGSYEFSEEEWKAYELMYSMGRLVHIGGNDWRLAFPDDEEIIIQTSAIESLVSKGLARMTRNEAYLVKPVDEPVKAVQLDSSVKPPAPPPPKEMEWHCPYCGSLLKRVPEEDEVWGAFCKGYEEDHGTKWYLCSKTNCTFAEMPLVLCHPVLGWDHPAGDSFAIAYVK